MAKAPEYRHVENVSLTKLHLDPENPRHHPIADEDKIVAQLVGVEKVLKVAKDIATKGGISPLDRIGVIDLEGSPGHYLVVEGNRRACALKLLHDPRKAPNTKTQAAMEALRASASVPAKVPVVVFRSREAAAPWLRLRHLGEQDGIGTRPWSTTAKDRFADGNTPDRLAIEVLERAEAAGWIDADQRRSVPVTTLRRYLGNQTVRAALGLGSHKELQFTHEPEEVDRALKHFVHDALPVRDGQAKVHSRTRAEDWKAYGRELHSTGVAPKTTLAKPIAPPAATPQVKGPSLRNPRSPDSRKYVVTSAFVVKKTDKNLQRILNELRSISPDEAPFSVNYLVRAAIERIMVLYAQKHQFHKPKQPDNVLIQLCERHLQANGVPATQLKTMQVAGSNNSATFSLDTLGSAVHGAQLPTRKGLIGVWDNWEPCLQLMVDRL